MDASPRSPTGSATPIVWDYFIAHAGGDVQAAEALYAHLSRSSRTFLDSRSLKPGDDWSLELPRAQEASRVTVILVSRNTEHAYYQREEIAAAINAAREHPDERRVVPVYLEASGSERLDVPYGLRLRHGIVARSADDMASVAARLLGDVSNAAPDLLHASLTGFVGRTERGPTHALRVSSYAEFVELYGQPVGPAQSFLGYAVRGYFENGGSQACLARVVPPDATAAAVSIPAQDGEPCLTIRAIDPGNWGNGLRIALDEGARVGVRLCVWMSDSDSGKDTPVADFDNLSVDPAGPNFLLSVIEASSIPIVAEWTGAFDRLPQFGEWLLAGGTDGSIATADDYAGSSDLHLPLRGLAAFDHFPDLALLCVPDCCNPTLPVEERERLFRHTLTHCERFGEQLAIVAPDPDETDPKAPADSAYAALYAPWIRVPAADGKDGVLVPPVGHIAGAIARRDAERGVCAPLTELVIEGLAASDTTPAHPLGSALDANQADRLRRRGINALRAGDRSGTAVSGSAITMAVDAQLQPLHLRRQIAFLKSTLRLGTQWLTFEPSTPDTHQRLVKQISEFLEAIWRQGMLAGSTPDEAFFVRCDETTMSADDRANGRIVGLVGVTLADPPGPVMLTLLFSVRGAESYARIG